MRTKTPEPGHDTRRDPWLRTAGHELRNHLQSVVALAESTHRHRRGPAGRRWLSQMRAATCALSDLAEDWLGSGGTAADFEPRKLIRVLLAAHRPSARRKALALRCHISADCPARVHGDRRAFRTLVANLVGNAIKFTPRGAVTVRLTGRRIGVLACLHLEVDDTGPGLGDASGGDLARLGEASRRNGGSGLGLRLASQAAVALGGALLGGSTPAGGARFITELSLPLAQRRAKAPTPRRLRVLVVEDHPANRAFARRALASEGHAVRSSGSAGGGLRLAGRMTFDLALVDLGLPDIAGVELARRLRRLQPRLRIVAWTGAGGRLPIVFAARIGKPCAAGQLAAAAEPAEGRETAGEDAEERRAAREILRRHARREGEALDSATRMGEPLSLAAAAHRARGALALAGLDQLAALALRAEQAAEAGRVREAILALGKVSGGLRRLGAGLT